RTSCCLAVLHRASHSFPTRRSSDLGGTHRALASIAERHDATAAQVSLAWVVRDGDVIAIPKAATVAHVKQNRGAVDLKLTARDLDRKSTRLNSSHEWISYAVFCLKK